MVIDVTAEDIAAALAARSAGPYNVCRDCPIARAVTRTFNKQLAVGLMTIADYGADGESVVLCELPEEAQQFVQAFDGRKTPVTPFSFAVEVND
jgi:hypothetical protein